eukprot:6188901-Pleurochrysis_carterae.AAC.1
MRWTCTEVVETRRKWATMSSTSSVARTLRCDASAKRRLNSQLRRRQWQSVTHVWMVVVDHSAIRATASVKLANAAAVADKGAAGALASQAAKLGVAAMRHPNAIAGASIRDAEPARSFPDLAYE